MRPVLDGSGVSSDGGGQQHQALVASGGALARNPLWRQLIADATGRPLLMRVEADDVSGLHVDSEGDEGHGLGGEAYARFGARVVRGAGSCGGFSGSVGEETARGAALLAAEALARVELRRQAREAQRRCTAQAQQQVLQQQVQARLQEFADDRPSRESALASPIRNLPPQTPTPAPRTGGLPPRHANRSSSSLRRVMSEHQLTRMAAERRQQAGSRALEDANHSSLQVRALMPTFQRSPSSAAFDSDRPKTGGAAATVGAVGARHKLAQLPHRSQSTGTLRTEARFATAAEAVAALNLHTEDRRSQQRKLRERHQQNQLQDLPQHRPDRSSVVMVEHQPSASAHRAMTQQQRRQQRLYRALLHPVHTVTKF